uniref:Uncharacterized protein n=1 Tax=Pundamilia nyererei TaxID=303518 RepID=A0A3B4FPD7_9CICH
MSLQVLKGHDDHVITCLQFSGDLIVSGSDDNTLKVWSAITGKCLRTLTGHTGGVWCSQMAATTVISGSTDRTLRVWDAESGECVHTLYGHTSTTLTHTHKLIAALTEIQTHTSEVCLHTLQGHTNRVYSLQFDGVFVVSGSLDTSIKVWDPETGRPHGLCFLTLRDNILVSGNADSTVRVWDIRTGQCLHTLQGEKLVTSLRGNLSD